MVLDSRIWVVTYDDLPEPPWWEVPNRGQPRSSLTRETIVTAALAVLDLEGLDGLTMRRVAQELGTGAASLYWHVAGKEQLIHLVLDRIIGEVKIPEPDPSRWQEQIREFAHDSRIVIRSHRDAALASLGRVPMGPNLIQVLEWFLTVLRGAGIPDRPASWFPDLFALFGAAQSVEDQMPNEQGSAPTAMGGYLASLPADRFPNLQAVLPELIGGDADARFEFGLELLLRGLATYAEPDR